MFLSAEPGGKVGMGMKADASLLFDRKAAALAQQRAERLGGDRFLERAAIEGLAERLLTVKRRFQSGLWLGRAVPEELRRFAENWRCADFDCHEVLTCGGGFDLALSLFSLQTINDLPGALVQIHRVLHPDGLFMAAMLGGDSLNELRDAFIQAESLTCGGVSPRVAPFADIRASGGLLQRAGFALPVADCERLIVRYRDFFSLVRDLRAHGLTNVMRERSLRPLRRETLRVLLDCYVSKYSDPDGRLRASFETLYLTGWSPHESQQKPLAPGSAQTSLVSALKAAESRLKLDDED